MSKKLYIEEEGASRGAPFENSFAVPWSLVQRFIEITKDAESSIETIENINDVVQEQVSNINDQISLQCLFSAWKDEDIEATTQQLEQHGKLYLLGEEQYFGLGFTKSAAKKAIEDAKDEEG